MKDVLLWFSFYKTCLFYDNAIVGTPVYILFIQVFHAGRGYEAGGRGQSCDHPAVAPLLRKGKIQ
jgi:hypothetical protein